MFRMTCALSLGLLLLPALLAQEPSKETATTGTHSPTEKAFFDKMKAVQSKLMKASAYSVRAESNWMLTGGKSEPTGSSTVTLIALNPGKVRIEVGIEGEKTPHLTVASDGKAITRLFATADMYSVTPCDGTPLDDIQRDGITMTALRSMGVDFLARPDVSTAIAAQVLAVDALGTVKDRNGYRITQANGHIVSIWFSDAAEPLPVEVDIHYDLAVGETKNLTFTSKTSLKWEFGGKPGADAFAVAVPASAKKVNDLFEAIVAPDVEELIGKPAPEVEFTGLDGKPITLTQFKGKPVVVYAWATWAAPGVESLPGLAKFVNDYEAKGVTFLAVNIGDTPEAVKQFITNAKFTGKVALDPLGTSLGAIRAQSVPAVVVIDQEGKVNSYHRGRADTAEKVKAELDKLLK